MEPNNMSAGMPNNTNNMSGDGTMPRNDAAMEMQAAIVADQIANPVGQQPQENIMAETVVAQKKGGKGALIAAVLFAVLAVGGIGFGVWTMMDGNSQRDSLNSQISSLKKQNSELLDKVAELNEEIEKLEKATADNSNNTNNNSNNTTNNVDASSQVSGIVMEGRFLVKDGNGAVVAKDDMRTVMEIISCDGGSNGVALQCKVVTSEGEGAYKYDLNDKTLNFVLAGNTDGQ